MTAGQVKLLRPSRIADAASRIRHIFIHDFVLPCSIGVHRHERGAQQRVRINVDLAVGEPQEPLDDEIGNVVCYESVAAAIREVVEQGHVNLVETLAEKIADVCLSDQRVRFTRVRVEKLDILPDARSVGVEIERNNAERRERFSKGFDGA
jgi:dihydroneopterin aldolase